MAQKTEKEETEFKVHETLTLCVNNCGVTGNPATNNMCQKCFNATTTTTASSSSAASTITTTTSVVSPSTTATATNATGTRILNRSARSARSRLIFRDPPLESGEKVETTSDREKVDVVVTKREINRCGGCKRKVGLTGFRCRCGELFCGEHRYSDRHDCSYDYKTAGREAIARENPVVKAAKIVRV